MGFATLFIPALRFDRITEPAPCMRHATHMDKTIGRNHGVVTIVSIRLKVTLKAFQQALGYPGTPARVIVIQYNPIIGWATTLHPDIGF